MQEKAPRTTNTENRTVLIENGKLVDGTVADFLQHMMNRIERVEQSQRHLKGQLDDLTGRIESLERRVSPLESILHHQDDSQASETKEIHKKGSKLAKGIEEDGC